MSRLAQQGDSRSQAILQKYSGMIAARREKDAFNAMLVEAFVRGHTFYVSKYLIRNLSSG